MQEMLGEGSHKNYQSADHSGVSRFALWFGLLGGAVAWLAHLLLSYAVSEFGCASGLREVATLGVTGVTWSLIVVRFVTLLIAGIATFIARRSGNRLREREVAEAHGPGIDMAQAGFITSGLFVFIIVVESVPIVFFLEGC